MSDVTTADQVKLGLETWKTAVQVQQHFNTIEMQIRSLAVTVLTATIAAAAVIQSTRVVLFGGLLAWVAFYFMDRWWYHRLLQGSVAKGLEIEAFLKRAGYDEDVVGLTTSVSSKSPFKLFKFEVHSWTKIDLFYVLIAIVQVLLIVFWA